jgi:CheY-like chemotaxis protein
MAYLPISDEPLTEDPLAHTPPPKLTSRAADALVLVAEDNPSVRKVVVTVLERAGYRVIEASHPHDALTLAREQAGPIDLLLTDLVMPSMNGTELARRLRAQRPGLPVLCMSGYSEEAVTVRGVLDDGVHLLAKPVMPEQLLKAVAQMLKREARPTVE